MVVNPRIEYINHVLSLLTDECTDLNIFLAQLNTLLLNTQYNAPSYIEGSHHIDEIYILYKYMYDHIQYVIESKGIELLGKILITSTKFMERINKLNEDTELDDEKCPSYLRDMAADIIRDTGDLLSTKISERLSILESHNII